jgi:hypothetical protein
VQVVDQDQDRGAGVAAAEADMVQPVAVAQGDFAVAVDGVVADSVVAADEGLSAGGGFRPGEVGLVRGLPGQGAFGRTVL